MVTFECTTTSQGHAFKIQRAVEKKKRSVSAQASVTSLTRHNLTASSFTLSDSSVWHPGHMGGCTQTHTHTIFGGHSSQVTLHYLLFASVFTCMYVHLNNVSFHHYIHTHFLHEVLTWCHRSQHSSQGALWLGSEVFCMCSCFYIGRKVSRVMHHEFSLNYSITQNCHSLKPEESWVFFWSMKDTGRSPAGGYLKITLLFLNHGFCLNKGEVS